MQTEQELVQALGENYDVEYATDGFDEVDLDGKDAQGPPLPRLESETVLGIWTPSGHAWLLPADDEADANKQGEGISGRCKWSVGNRLTTGWRWGPVHQTTVKDLPDEPIPKDKLGEAGRMGT